LIATKTKYLHYNQGSEPEIFFIDSGAQNVLVKSASERLEFCELLDFELRLKDTKAFWFFYYYFY